MHWFNKNKTKNEKGTKVHESIYLSTYLYYNHKTNSVKKFSLEVSNWLPVQYSYDMEIFGFSFLDVKLWWYSIFLATIVLRIVATNNLEIGFDFYF